LEDGLLLLFGQPAVVAELAVLRRSVPGRHPAFFDHLGYRRGPAGGLLVSRQREGSDVALAMALDTAFLKDASNLVREGDLALALDRLHSTDEAAGDRGFRLADGLAGEQFVQGGFEIGTAGLVTRVADAELIVDPAPIADDALAVEDE